MLIISANSATHDTSFFQLVTDHCWKFSVLDPIGSLAFTLWLLVIKNGANSEQIQLSQSNTINGAVMELVQLWDMIVWFLRTSWPPLALRLLPEKGGWTFRVTSPNSCLSFRKSRNGEELTLRDDCMVFEDLLTSSWIEAAARKGGVDL